MNLCTEALYIVLVLIFLVFLYFKKCYLYWEKKGVYVSSKPTLIFGNALPLLTRKLPIRNIFKNIYDDSQRNLKKMSGFYFFGKPCLVITDLDLVKSVMKSDFQFFADRLFHNHESDPLSEHIISVKGEKWKKLRALLTPLFTSAKTKMMFPIMVKYANQFVAILQSLNTKTVEIQNFTDRYSMDVTGSCVFGIECNCLRNVNSEFEHYAKQYYSVSLIQSFKFMLSFFCPDVLRYLKTGVITKAVGDFFLKTVSEAIRFREENNVVREDFMHLLIQIRNNVEIKENEIGVLRTEGKAGLSLSETNVTAESVMLFMAGYETTASTICFCLYELSINIDNQEKARRNVIETLAKHNGAFCYDAVNEMDYIDKCVKETLRKYSPTPVHMRECTKQYIIPGTNVIIEKGTPVFIPFYGIHMDSNIFPNPEKFDPERFTEEHIYNRHPSSWIPFGFGPRNCLGIKFGMTEAKTCVAKLLMNFNFTANPLTKVPITISTVSTVTTPENGIWLNVTTIN